MKPKKLAIIVAAAAAFLITAESCSKSAGASYPAGQVKNYGVPAGKLSLNLSVYLPGGYDESASRYPVLYLLHGDDGDDRTFFGGGYQLSDGAMSDANVGVIMDGLLQKGRIRPFIVACPALKSDGDFLRYFVPFVDATFRTIAEKRSRAVAGHSSGGYLAMETSLAHPEMFSVAGGFAAHALLAITPNVSGTTALRSHPVSYWLYAGAKDTVTIPWTVKGFAGELKKADQSVTYLQDDGDHVSKVAARLPEFLEFLSRRFTAE